MSDLTFNKYAAAGLGTAFFIALLVQASGFVFAPEQVKKPGFAVEVTEETAGAAEQADNPPDWGTVLPTADVAAGAAIFAKCKSCHTIDAGGPNGTGPNLHGVVGRKPGSHPGFAYSSAMTDFGAKQPVWDYDHIYEFIKGPQKYINGTKMTFVGLKKPEDRVNVIAYLRSQGGTLPIPAPDPSRQPGATPAPSAPTGEKPAGGSEPAPGAAAAGQPTATGAATAPGNPAGGPTGTTGPSLEKTTPGSTPSTGQAQPAGSTK
jgi:cytochrome c